MKYASTGGTSAEIICAVYSNNTIQAETVTNGFRPVVSLKSDIKITGGNGTQSSPWQLGI